MVTKTKKIIKKGKKSNGVKKAIDNSRATEQTKVYKKANSNIVDSLANYKAFPVISDVEYELLKGLQGNPGVSMTALSEISNRDVQSTGNPIQRLKNKGYIYVSSYQQKSREKSLELTDLALEAISVIENGRYETKKMMVVFDQN